MKTQTKKETLGERRSLIYVDERGRYKVFRVLKKNDVCSNKMVWVCCCGKEFKQHKRFHKHNCDICFNKKRKDKIKEVLK